MKNRSRNAYRIINGGDHYTERFCSLSCTEAFIEKHHVGWIIVGMRSTVPTDKRCTATHSVQIRYSTELSLYDDRIQATSH